jgi:uncharacterized membrane protein HdeD (DUF308 family)
MADRIWWVTLLRGMLGVLLGLLLLVWPDKSAEALIMFVGAFALLTGLIITMHALGARYLLWRGSLTGGLLTVALGLIALLWPGITAAVVIYLIAAWALVFGIVEVLAGLTVGAGSPVGALVMGIGIVSIILALILFVVPEAGIVMAAWLIGFYFLASGGLTVYNAIEVRREWAHG